MMAMTLDPVSLMNRELTVVGFGKDSNKLVNDFRYVFEDRLHFRDSIKWNGDRTDLTDRFLVCCTYDRAQALKELKGKDLTYQKDFCFAEDLFSILDDHKHRRIAYLSYPGSLIGQIRAIVFGYAAKHGKILPREKHREILKGHYEKDASDRFGSRLVRTSPVRKLIYLKYLILGAAESIAQLSAKGNDYEAYDHICFESVSDAIRFQKDHPSAAGKVITVDELKAHTMTSLYMRAVYFDRKMKNCFCDAPFKKLWIGKNGMTRMCECPDFLEVGFGNAGVTDLKKIWKSPLAKIVRLSMLNHSYTFCSEELCGMLRVCGDLKELPAFPETAEENDQPGELMIANDRVCNLCCPSCRNTLYTKNNADEAIIAKAGTDALLASGWPDRAEELIVGGSGEAFLSENYKQVLYDGKLKRNRIRIMTNGILFTPQEWEKLEGKYEHIVFSVSVDAATKNTYEKVRCGGNYERLMKNMEFLSELRKENKVDCVIVNLIVQRANYREIPDFIRWAKMLGFDRVSLSHIRNWGTFTEKEFQNEVSMFDKNGNMKAELARVLEDPVCRDPVVEMQWES